MAIAGDNDDAAAIDQRFERMQKLLVGRTFAGQELEVVDDQQVDITKVFAESRQFSLLESRQETVSEIFRSQIANSPVAASLDEALCDSVQKMRLADAGGAVKNQRAWSLLGVFHQTE